METPFQLKSPYFIPEELSKMFFNSHFPQKGTLGWGGGRSVFVKISICHVIPHFKRLKKLNISANEFFYLEVFQNDRRRRMAQTRGLNLNSIRNGVPSS